MDRPTIFLSSTVFDFRDLRSALKSYLETRGCRVLASEYDVFPQALDQHSYQACLDSIAQADIFVLMIGTRVGGWYDTRNRISITQKEYRRAYELAAVGRMRILTFVRDEVWTLRQNTKELERYLTSRTEIDIALRADIIRHPTKFLEDAEFINAFIDEVSRNKETAAAAEGVGIMPIGNWIRPFRDFVDVTAAIDPHVLNGLVVKDAAGRTALLNQILALLQRLLSLHNDRVFEPFDAIRKLTADINLKTDDLTRQITLNKAQWEPLLYLSTFTHRTPIEVEPLVAVLNSDLLLDYDPETGAFHPLEAYDVLTELVDEARKFNGSLSGNELVSFLMHGKKHSPDRAVSVPVIALAGQLGRLLNWANTVLLAKSLARYLSNQPLVRPSLLPQSPFFDEVDRLSKEKTSLAQIRAFVGIDQPKPTCG